MYEHTFLEYKTKTLIEFSNAVAPRPSPSPSSSLSVQKFYWGLVVSCCATCGPKTRDSTVKYFFLSCISVLF